MAAIAAQMKLWPVIKRIFARPRKPSAAPGLPALQARARRKLRHLPEHMLRDLGL